MKAYKLASGNIVIVIATADNETKQYELSESDPAIKSNYSQEYLDGVGEMYIDGEPYSMAQNACVYSKNKASHDECQLIYSLIEEKLNG